MAWDWYFDFCHRPGISKMHFAQPEGVSSFFGGMKRGEMFCKSKLACCLMARKLIENIQHVLMFYLCHLLKMMGFSGFSLLCFVGVSIRERTNLHLHKIHGATMTHILCKIPSSFLSSFPSRSYCNNSECNSSGNIEEVISCFMLKLQVTKTNNKVHSHTHRIHNWYMGVSKIGVPQNGWFIMVPNPIKIHDLGGTYPYFWFNTPYMSILLYHKNKSLPSGKLT